ncbi:MAG: hypothetical protein ACFCVE_15735 [Phycisphaerae bacterium]
MTQAPLNYQAAQFDAVWLREVAQQQRMICICILIYIGLIAAQFVVPAGLKLVLGVAVLGVVVTAAVFVFMLAIRIFGTAVGVVLGILTLIPLIGLIVLLVVNSKATGILRRHGVQVGLLGADPKTISV